MGMAKFGLRTVALAAAGAMLLAACGGSDSAGSNGDAATRGTPTAGGTLTFLDLREQFTNVDPQRVYTGEDLALFSGTIFRTLTAFKYSSDNAEGTSLTPDMATDTGRPSEDGAVWEFTIRDGVTFQDGTPVGCKDIKYGVSRTFATDLITNGPAYAISMLDVEGYLGPYSEDPKNNVEGFDKAIVCSADDKTITFNLSRPVPDFNYTVTLSAFAPVPEAADTGEKYDDMPVSSGPYQIQTYKKGKGGTFVLVRNPNWAKASDPYRPAYVDSYVFEFGIEPSVSTQRVVSSSGDDASALTADILSADLATIFNDPAMENRRINELDPYVRYYAINQVKVPNIKHRQAMMVALDREALRTVAGGAFAGDLGDGVIKPNIGIDYAPTNLWTSLLGQEIPDAGDPEYAKQLITESGEAMPTIRFNYAISPDNDKAAAVVVDSLGKAGIKVELKGLEAGAYYGVVFDPEKAGELMTAGWGPDWPNASTVIPELFTPSGGFNLSQADDADFNAGVEAAKVNADRAAQATQWQALNTEAMQKGFAIPTRFGRDQRIAGTAVGADVVYLWPAYGSWPYGAMWVQSS